MVSQIMGKFVHAWLWDTVEWTLRTADLATGVRWHGIFLHAKRILSFIIMNENKIIVSLHFMGSQCSLPHSQELATTVYPQPD
jgi:hypothetical protein